MMVFGGLICPTFLELVLMILAFSLEGRSNVNDLQCPYLPSGIDLAVHNGFDPDAFVEELNSHPR